MERVQALEAALVAGQTEPCKATVFAAVQSPASIISFLELETVDHSLLGYFFSVVGALALAASEESVTYSAMLRDTVYQPAVEGLAESYDTATPLSIHITLAAYSFLSEIAFNGDNSKARLSSSEEMLIRTYDRIRAKFTLKPQDFVMWSEFVLFPLILQRRYDTAWEMENSACKLDVLMGICESAGDSGFSPAQLLPNIALLGVLYDKHNTPSNMERIFKFVSPQEYNKAVCEVHKELNLSLAE